MMNTHFLGLSVLTFLAGFCAPAKTGIERYAFDFSYEGDTYQIVSLVEPQDGGRNYLIRRDGERVILRARDSDQDGRIDTVLAGASTLSNADAIYGWGIAQARASGKHHETVRSADPGGVAATTSNYPGRSEQARPPTYPSYSILVFTKVAGYVHESIPDGVAAIEDLGARNGFTVAATDDATAFRAAALDSFAAIVFLNTTLDVLDDSQQDVFKEFIQEGGGFVGVHSAADTEYDWPWYGGLVGAYFESHPKIQAASIAIEDTLHSSTSGLPVAWERTDEWYNFQSNPRGRVHVLATIDETSYEGGNMDGDHPMSWCHEYDGGRSWYTAFGHTRESYSEPLFLAHLLGGIGYAAGVLHGECTATAPAP